jgi:hypothetical protein
METAKEYKKAFIKNCVKLHKYYIIQKGLEESITKQIITRLIENGKYNFTKNEENDEFVLCNVSAYLNDGLDDYGFDIHGCVTIFYVKNSDLSNDEINEINEFHKFPESIRYSFDRISHGKKITTKQYSFDFNSIFVNGFEVNLIH